MASHPVARRPSPVVSEVELSLIVPVYNEADVIEGVLREWKETLACQTDSFEILVVNDGSTDGTGRILDRTRREFPCLRVFHQLNAGRDLALKRGMGIAKGRYFLLVEGNGRYEPADFEKLWALRRQGAVVLGARVPRLAGAVESLLLWARRKLMRFFFGLELVDPNTPFRLVSRRFLEDVIERLSVNGEELPLSMTLLFHQDDPKRVMEATVRYQLAGLPMKRRGTIGLLFRALREALELTHRRLGAIRLSRTARQPAENATQS